jgi:hypothetical protein
MFKVAVFSEVDNWCALGLEGNVKTLYRTVGRHSQYEQSGILEAILESFCVMRG